MSKQNTQVKASKRLRKEVVGRFGRQACTTEPDIYKPVIASSHLLNRAYSHSNIGAKILSISEPRNILTRPNRPINRKEAMALLLSIQDHLRHSGQRGRQIFDHPLEAHQGLQKAIKKLANLWVRKQLTPRAELQKFRKARPRSRRILYKQKMQVFSKSTVSSMRTALPAVHGQGWLRRRVEVFPYGPVYTFNAEHRVNVYRKGDRFDVIDALCNIPILAGLTRQGLKKAVQW